MLTTGNLSQKIFATLFVLGFIAAFSGRACAGNALLDRSQQQIAMKKYKAAVRTLTKAMNSGKLSDKEMARALYQRGVAYNGQKRRSAAIADLTGALFLGGLGAHRQKDAYRQRAMAYQASGYSRLARRDMGRVGNAGSGFRTMVRSAGRAGASRASLSGRSLKHKKPAIPAFKTSIAVNQ